MKTGLLKELSIAPEVAYVLGLCRRDSSSLAQESLQPAAEGFDWEGVLKYASRHRLGPTIYWKLRGFGFPGVPEPVIAELEGTFRSTVGTNLAFARLIVRLLDRLEGAGVQVIALKGPVAAYVHHGNLAARQFGDLDLLVPLGHAQAALAELRALGFAPEVPLGERHFCVLLRTRREVNLRHPNGWVVDLHWDSLGSHLSWCAEEALWQRSVEVDFEGRRVRTLGRVDLAAYYGLKAAEDGWRAAYQLLDASRAFEVLGEEEWDHLVLSVDLGGKWRAVATSVLFAHELLGVAVPCRVLDEAERRRDVRKLAARAAPRLLRPESRGLSLPLRVMEQMQCLERWRDKVSLVRTVAITPSERDLTVLPCWLTVPPLPQVVRVGRTITSLAASLASTLKYAWIPRVRGR